MRVVSGDSHVVEPHDLWTNKLASTKYADRAPAMAPGAAGFEFRIDGLAPFPVGLAGAAGRSSDDLSNEGELREGGWKTSARLDDMDLDGIAAEVLYPSVGMSVVQAPDHDYQLACIRAYNDWLVEFCAAAPDRLVGLALIPVYDVDVAVAEIDRAHRMGLRGALIPAIPTEGHYAESRFDAMWAALSERNVPVSFHVLTGGRAYDPTLGSGIRLIGLMSPVHHIQNTLGLLMFGKVFDRHPALRVVSAEHDGGWIAHYGYRMEQMYERHHNWLGQGIALDRSPTEYLRSRVWYTFQKDPIAVETRHRVGITQLLWASDYPHSDSTWPHSQKVIERDFAGVPHDEVAAIVGTNAAELYGLAH